MAEAVKADIPSGPVDLSRFIVDTIIVARNATAQLIEKLGRLRWSKF